MNDFLTDLSECLEIAACCRDPARRFVGQWEKDQNSKWHPHTVRVPGGNGRVFTDAEAWEFVADLIADHHAIRVVLLRVPPGAIGYVMVISIEKGQPDLYIKLARSRTGKVIGRSFHYCNH